MSPIEDLIAEEWCASLQSAWSLARGERLAELEGKYLKRFDGRGLHPYSQLWGQVFACETLLPALAELRDTGDHRCEAYSLREAARREADAIYAARIIEEAQKEAAAA